MAIVVASATVLLSLGMTGLDVLIAIVLLSAFNILVYLATFLWPIAISEWRRQQAFVRAIERRLLVNWINGRPPFHWAIDPCIPYKTACRLYLDRHRIGSLRRLDRTMMNHGHQLFCDECAQHIIKSTGLKAHGG